MFNKKWWRLCSHQQYSWESPVWKKSSCYKSFESNEILIKQTCLNQKIPTLIVLFKKSATQNSYDA
jgi:hypothetical protein